MTDHRAEQPVGDAAVEPHDEGGFCVRVLCGEWHPTLWQPWGSPPACSLDAGHSSPHLALYLGDDDQRGDVRW